MSALTDVERILAEQVRAYYERALKAEARVRDLEEVQGELLDLLDNWPRPFGERLKIGWPAEAVSCHWCGHPIGEHDQPPDPLHRCHHDGCGCRGWGTFGPSAR